MKKSIYLIGMALSLLVFSPALNAGIWKTGIFLKNNTHVVWTDTLLHKPILLQSRENIATISRKGLLGKDSDQEYRAKFVAEGYPTLLIAVSFSELHGLRVMVRDEKKTETTGDWISIPTGNGTFVFGVGKNLFVKVSYYVQAGIQDIDFAINSVLPVEIQ